MQEKNNYHIYKPHSGLIIKKTLTGASQAVKSKKSPKAFQSLSGIQHIKSDCD